MLKTIIERILVPTDLSPLADRALRYAGMLQRQFGSHVTLLGVDDAWITADLLDHPFGYCLENSSERKQTLAGSLRDRAAQLGIKADISVVYGSPASTIVGTAISSGADLIVMSTHGRTGWRRLFLGSVAERVLEKSPRPTLLISAASGDEGPTAIRRVVCPVNFSEAARISIRWAARLAVEAGAELVLVHVLERAHCPSLVSAEEGLRAWLPAGVRERSRYEEVVLHGDATRVADALRGDLIVLGVGRRHSSDVAVPGTTASQLIRSARAPVLVVPELNRSLAGTHEDAVESEVVLASQ